MNSVWFGLSQLTCSRNGLVLVCVELELLAEEAHEVLAIENGDENYESY